jgi:hypothetical protein
VPRFPGWTHLLATVAFPVWVIGTEAHYYGIDTRDGWWQSLGSWGPLLVVVVSIVVLPPAVALETVAVLRIKYRWVARLVVVCYVLIAGYVTFIPTGLRFFGDTSPTPVDLVVVSVVSFGIVIGAQALLTYVICRLWLRRRAAR